MRLFRTLLLMVALAPSLLAGTPGTFRGMLMQTADGKPGWVFIQGRNGSMRKVEISKAVVTYAETVPQRRRQKSPSEDALNGADVRVTATQDGDGEWRASEIEVLRLRARE